MRTSCISLRKLLKPPTAQRLHIDGVRGLLPHLPRGAPQVLPVGQAIGTL